MILEDLAKEEDILKEEDEDGNTSPKKKSPKKSTDFLHLGGLLGAREEHITNGCIQMQWHDRIVGVTHVKLASKEGQIPFNHTSSFQMPQLQVQVFRMNQHRGLARVMAKAQEKLGHAFSDEAEMDATQIHKAFLIGTTHLTGDALAYHDHKLYYQLHQIEPNFLKQGMQLRGGVGLKFNVRKRVRMRVQWTKGVFVAAKKAGFKHIVRDDLFVKIFWEIAPSKRERPQDILLGTCLCTHVQKIKISKKEKKEATTELRAIKKENAEAVKLLREAEVEHNKLSQELVAPTEKVEMLKQQVQAEEEVREHLEGELDYTRQLLAKSVAEYKMKVKEYEALEKVHKRLEKEAALAAREQIKARKKQKECEDAERKAKVRKTKAMAELEKAKAATVAAKKVLLAAAKEKKKYHKSGKLQHAQKAQKKAAEVLAKATKVRTGIDKEMKKVTAALDKSKEVEAKEVGKAEQVQAKDGAKAAKAEAAEEKKQSTYLQKLEKQLSKKHAEIQEHMERAKEETEKIRAKAQEARQSMSVKHNVELMKKLAGAAKKRVECELAYARVDSKHTAAVDVETKAAAVEKGCADTLLECEMEWSALEEKVKLAEEEVAACVTTQDTAHKEHIAASQHLKQMTKALHIAKEEVHDAQKAFAKSKKKLANSKEQLAASDKRVHVARQSSRKLSDATKTAKHKVEDALLKGIESQEALAVAQSVYQEAKQGHTESLESLSLKHSHHEALEAKLKEAHTRVAAATQGSERSIFVGAVDLPVDESFKAERPDLRRVGSSMRVEVWTYVHQNFLNSKARTGEKPLGVMTLSSLDIQKLVDATDDLDEIVQVFSLQEPSQLLGFKAKKKRTRGEPHLSQKAKRAASNKSLEMRRALIAKLHDAAVSVGKVCLQLNQVETLQCNVSDVVGLIPPDIHHAPTIGKMEVFCQVYWNGWFLGKTKRAHAPYNKFTGEFGHASWNEGKGIDFDLPARPLHLMLFKNKKIKHNRGNQHKALKSSNIAATTDAVDAMRSALIPVKGHKLIEDTANAKHMHKKLVVTKKDKVQIMINEITRPTGQTIADQRVHEFMHSHPTRKDHPARGDPIGELHLKSDMFGAFTGSNGPRKYTLTHTQIRALDDESSSLAAVKPEPLGELMVSVDVMPRLVVQLVNLSAMQRSSISKYIIKVFHNQELILTTPKSQGPLDSPYWLDQFVQLHHMPYKVQGQDKQFLRIEVWTWQVSLCGMCHRRCKRGPCSCFPRAHRYWRTHYTPYTIHYTHTLSSYTGTGARTRSEWGWPCCRWMCCTRRASPYTHCAFQTSTTPRRGANGTCYRQCAC
jgi:hypothetical protein